jgi:hypothetical protein
MDLILKALQDKYLAQKSKALAELAILCQTPSGISEHSNIVEDAHKKIQQLTDAEGCLQILTNIIKENSNEEKT